MSTTSAEELRLIALSAFAESGYAATSLQRIADLAGVSKASVLYHFASKEALLEAAVSPALTAMEQVLTTLIDSPGREGRDAFIAGFVDFLLEHRLEVHLFINQGPALEDVPVVARANGLVQRLAERLAGQSASVTDFVRLGVALGGSAYLLVSQHRAPETFQAPEEVREALISVITELVNPRTTPGC